LALGKEPVVPSRSPSLLQYDNSGRSASDVDGRIDSEDLTDSLSDQEDLYSENESLYSKDSALEPEDVLDSEDDVFPSSSQRRVASRNKRLEDRKIHDRAQRIYVEAFDDETKQLEEERLWLLLRQTAPFELKSGPSEIPKRPRGIGNQADSREWRDNTEYWSQWETLRTPVPNESFIKNRQRRSRKAQRRERERRLSRHSSKSTDNEGSIDESDGEQGEVVRSHEEGIEGDYDEVDDDEQGNGEEEEDTERDDDGQIPAHEHSRSIASHSPTPHRGTGEEDFSGSDDEIFIKDEYDD